jgi:hypothetical protein
LDEREKQFDFRFGGHGFGALEQFEEQPRTKGDREEVNRRSKLYRERTVVSFLWDQNLE